MADMNKSLKGIWMKGMEAIGDAATKIAANTKQRVNEMNVINRRAEILKDFGAKSYELWQKGEKFPEELDGLLNELHQLETELAGIRAEKAAAKPAPAAPVENEPPEDEATEEETSLEEKLDELKDKAEDALESIGESLEDAAEALKDKIADEDEQEDEASAPVIDVADENVIEELEETQPAEEEDVPTIKVEE